MRLFLVREGFTAKDDVLPERFFLRKTDGALSEHDVYYSRQDMEDAKSYYYSIMGWDAGTGIPTQQRLQELGIERG